MCCVSATVFVASSGIHSIILHSIAVNIFVINWQREPWPVRELSLAVYHHYNKIFDPYNNSISIGSKPKSVDSKCSELWEMVRPKFCGLAQALNEMKPNVPQFKTPLESEALLSFERVSIF